MELVEITGLLGFDKLNQRGRLNQQGDSTGEG